MFFNRLKSDFMWCLKDVVILMIGTPGPRSILATRPPPLVAVDNFSVIFIARLLAQQSRTFSII